MKYLGKIVHDKDVTNKEYVDTLHEEIVNSKLGESDLEEFSNNQILLLWNQIMENTNL